MSQSEIILYGVSGYTGKLIAESLHNRGISFTAAGRNPEKIAAALELVARRAGAASVDATVVKVSHDEESLTELFSGAQVVVNVTGPFMQMGETVVKSALAAGCHYLDTTGEQDFMLAMREAYGAAYSEKGLLLAPACSYMWTMGALAAEIALENSAIDSLDLTYISAQGAPSIASSQSFMRMLAAPHYYLANNALMPWTLGRTWDVTIPGYAKVFKGSSWGGAGEPVWFQHDERVRNCTVYQCAEDNDLMEMIVAGVQQIVEGTGGDENAREEMAIATAGSIVQEEPPKEDPLLQRGTIHCNGTGSNTKNFCTLNFHSPYVITGEFIAHGCEHLLAGAPKEVGFASPASAFGHRELIDMLSKQHFLEVIEG